MKPSEALNQYRDEIRNIIKRHHGINPRIYGSVLRGEDDENSDLDIVIETLPETDLFDLGGMHHDLTELMGVEVDIKTELEIPERIRAKVLSNAKLI